MGRLPGGAQRRHAHRKASRPRRGRDRPARCRAADEGRRRRRPRRPFAARLAAAGRAARGGPLTEKNLAAMLEAFGHAGDGERCPIWRRNFAASAPGRSKPWPAPSRSSNAMASGRFVGAWLADALLAQLLGWSHARSAARHRGGAGGRHRPAETGEAPVPATGPAGAERAKNLLAARARPALRAIDLSAELERRAQSCSPLRRNSGPGVQTRSCKSCCPATRWSRPTPSLA